MKNELLALYIGYMDKVLSNARVDYLRRLKRIHEHEILPGDVPDTTLIQDTHSFEVMSLEQLTTDISMQTALSSLSKNEAYVLLQLVCIERSVKAVADDLSIATTSVYRLKSRALRKLRNELIGGPVHG